MVHASEQANPIFGFKSSLTVLKIILNKKYSPKQSLQLLNSNLIAKCQQKATKKLIKNELLTEYKSSKLLQKLFDKNFKKTVIDSQYKLVSVVNLCLEKGTK